MRNRRFISLLLALLLVSPTVLASCSQNEEDETKSSANNNNQIIETEPEIETEPPDPATVDDLPADLTFNGADFTMHSASGWSSLVSGQVGEVLNDTQYAMETYVEERFDVNISENDAGDIDKLVLSGDTTYQALNLLDRDAVSYAIDNYFMPLSEVTNIDLTKLYWNNQLTEKLAIGNINFLALGCFNLESYRKTPD